MNKISVLDKSFIPFISSSEIEEKIKEIAQIIEQDYEGKRPLFIAVLNGSFLFVADLFRKIKIESEISFVKLASYEGTSSTGKVAEVMGLKENLHQRHIILVEDIIDTGQTLHEFIPQILKENPASLKIASLLIKPQSLQVPIEYHYFGFEIPNKFVVGYGLDYNGMGRNLPEIYQEE